MKSYSEITSSLETWVTMECESPGLMHTEVTCVACFYAGGDVVAKVQTKADSFADAAGSAMLGLFLLLAYGDTDKFRSDRGVTLEVQYFSTR